MGSLLTPKVCQDQISTRTSEELTQSTVSRHDLQLARLERFSSTVRNEVARRLVRQSWEKSVQRFSKSGSLSKQQGGRTLDVIDPNDFAGLRSTVMLAGGLQLVEDA